MIPHLASTGIGVRLNGAFGSVASGVEMFAESVVLSGVDSAGLATALLSSNREAKTPLQETSIIARDGNTPVVPRKKDREPCRKHQDEENGLQAQVRQARPRLYIDASCWGQRTMQGTSNDMFVCYETRHSARSCEWSTGCKPNRALVTARNVSSLSDRDFESSILYEAKRQLSIGH